MLTFLVHDRVSRTPSYDSTQDNYVIVIRIIINCAKTKQKKSHSGNTHFPTAMLLAVCVAALATLAAGQSCDLTGNWTSTMVRWGSWKCDLNAARLFLWGFSSSILLIYYTDAELHRPGAHSVLPEPRRRHPCPCHALGRFVVGACCRCVCLLFVDGLAQSRNVSSPSPPINIMFRRSRAWFCQRNNGLAADGLLRLRLDDWE